MENNQQRNMVIVDGEIVKLWGKRSDKAPTEFRVKNVERWNGNERTNYINLKSFNFPEDLKEGDFIHAIGGIRSGSYEKDGKKTYTQELFVNKIEKTDKPAEDVAPEDIPDGEITFDEVAF